MKKKLDKRDEKVYTLQHGEDVVLNTSKSKESVDASRKDPSALFKWFTNGLPAIKEILTMMSNTARRSSGSRFVARVSGYGIILGIVALLVACGGGGGGSPSTTATADPTPTVRAQSASISLESSVTSGVTAGSGITPPNPVPRDASLTIGYTKTGNPGVISATQSAVCDNSPFSLTTAVNDGASSGNVTFGHPTQLLPAGGECTLTPVVTGSTANPDGKIPSDTKAYSFVADSSAADRVVVLSSTHNHAPVVYVRQDNGSFVLHVPKADFSWTAGNCLIQRTPTSAQIRAVACKKIGVVDANFYVLALSAADWTLSADSAQVAKLGAVPAANDTSYWLDSNELVSSPTADLSVSIISKTGSFQLDGYMLTVSFLSGAGKVIVANNIGNIKSAVGW